MRWLAPFLVILAAGAVILGGGGPMARLALAAGFPHVALSLFDDPHWQGEALASLGRHEEATERFRQAGAAATFARANALARAGRIDQAVQAYDAVLARDPGDAAARENLDIVLRLLHGATEDGHGAATQGRVAGERNKGRNSTETITVEQAFERVRERSALVRRPMERRSTAAGEEWLATLPDNPGAYLKRVIAAEHARRRAQGLAPPPPESPW